MLQENHEICYIIFLSKSNLGSHQINKKFLERISTVALIQHHGHQSHYCECDECNDCRVAAEFKCSYIYLHVLYAKVRNVRASPRDFKPIGL